jgi:divalent metal cation (Fe/Co/Zn/Cd) transporter
MLRKLSAPQRTALASVAAAAVLVAIKLVVGLLAHSLGLIAEAIHSATDLVAALLTFFAVGVAGGSDVVVHVEPDTLQHD